MKLTDMWIDASRKAPREKQQVLCIIKSFPCIFKTGEVKDGVLYPYNLGYTDSDDHLDYNSPIKLKHILRYIYVPSYVN